MHIIVSTLHTGDNKDDDDDNNNNNNNNNNNIYLLTSGSTAQIPIKKSAQKLQNTKMM